MNEQTITPPTAAPDIPPGTLVLAWQTGSAPRLGIVTSLDGPDCAEVITAAGDDGGTVTAGLSRAILEPAPPVLDDAQQALARRLTLEFAAQACHRVGQLRSQVTHLRQQADAAHAKITAMRAYAIGKHKDGDICQDGLNAFLAAHDLELYQPRYAARIVIRANVEVTGADDENQAARMIRDLIEVTSTDEAGVQVDCTTGIDILSTEPLPGDD